jgi:hypothetical protein
MGRRGVTLAATVAITGLAAVILLTDAESPPGPLVEEPTPTAPRVTLPAIDDAAGYDLFVDSHAGWSVIIGLGKGESVPVRADVVPLGSGAFAERRDGRWRLIEPGGRTTDLPRGNRVLPGARAGEAYIVGFAPGAYALQRVADGVVMGDVISLPPDWLPLRGTVAGLLVEFRDNVLLVDGTQVLRRFEGDRVAVSAQHVALRSCATARKCGIEVVRLDGTSVGRFDGVTDGALSEDGRWFAALSDDAVVVHDLVTGDARRVDAMHATLFGSQFSPDGRWFAFPDGDTVRLAGTRGAAFAELPVSGGPFSVAFLPATRS